MSDISPTILERSNLIAQLLRESGAMRQITIAEEIAPLMAEVGEPPIKMGTAQAIVNDCLPVLYRCGRIRPVDIDQPRSTEWEATPSEIASAGLGVDIHDFAGTTTRWPGDSDKPPVGSHIHVDSSKFESKR
jgi:hypothetical protein